MRIGIQMPPILQISHQGGIPHPELLYEMVDTTLVTPYPPLEFSIHPADTSALPMRSSTKM